MGVIPAPERKRAGKADPTKLTSSIGIKSKLDIK